MTSYRGNPVYRGNAIAVGVLFIACSAASILSAVPLGSTLDEPGYLGTLAVSNDQVVLTALIELVWAATGAGIAIGLYPVLREHSPALALGSVAARVVEGVFVLVGTLSLLALLTVSQQAPAGAAASASSRATGDALLAVRDWALGFVGLLAFGIGALLYYYVFYTSRVVPRWLSVWGLVGAALMVVATIHSGFTQDFGFSTVTTVLNIPIGLQEIVLAVWLIIRGFTASTARPTAPSAVPSMVP
jgi:hypothetical protein